MKPFQEAASPELVEKGKRTMDPRELDLTTFEAMVRLVERLRAPGGCPWDREQTHDSLRSEFIQECYEVLDAIDGMDHRNLAEELGDVLLHIVFHALIAQEAGNFTVQDVLKGANEKLLRRHPHVFGDASAESAWEVERQWEKIKRKEQEGSGRSILEGVPRNMPALARSQGIQTRASRSGFDWDDLEGVLDKVQEEVRELKLARDRDEREHELGDVLFTLVNVARWMSLDAEGAMRRANDRFYQRFTHMERLCQERGLSFQDLPIEEKDTLWEEAKEAARGSTSSP